MNLPNSLTLIRIFLVPLLVVVLLTKVEWPVMGVSSQVLCAAIFGIASLTDWLATISAIEHDRVKLGVERAKVLARALKCHPGVLVFPGWVVPTEAAG